MSLLCVSVAHVLSFGRIRPNTFRPNPVKLNTRISRTCLVVGSIISFKGFSKKFASFGQTVQFPATKGQSTGDKGETAKYNVSIAYSV